MQFIWQKLQKHDEQIATRKEKLKKECNKNSTKKNFKCDTSFSNQKRLTRQKLTSSLERAYLYNLF